MMACVAKNVVAVQLFIEMGARLDLLNACGLNALMCAARAGKDPRPAAPAVPETMERSAAIVEILLANGADVNALEKNEGNAALHLAVLSKNFNAVESLIKISLDLDITIRNKAGKTAMDLGRQIFGESSKQMNDLLSEKWAQNFEESICLSAKVEQQLLALTAQEENIIALDEKPSLKYEKKKNKKTKKKNMGLVKAPERLPIECGHKDKMKADSFIDSSEDDTLSLKQSKAKADQESASLYSELRTIEHEFDDDGGWQSVSTKKNRRKELSGDNAEKASNRNPAISTNIGLKDCSSNIELGSLQKPHRSQLKISKAISSVNALWDEQPNSKLTQSTVTESPRRLVITGDDKNWVITSNLSYDVLNRSFYRTFPVAADLEINVEQFLIASSVSDRELEPNNSLSISQVEALQEAHWQAYHYLNEKKVGYLGAIKLSIILIIVWIHVRTFDLRWQFLGSANTRSN
ncbi:hypothetical protein CCR75_007871 [Bremia lactucae]|uniref:Uncharacterized protein n=1 Tax=Bremia lactucae TaxID=4779 RepID=A0A976FLC9_BRELC|nr:hypothetical protein CCR75_007871 [Bremia lactucae]